jgi:hypothetical protein
MKNQEKFPIPDFYTDGKKWKNALRTGIPATEKVGK